MNYLAIDTSRESLTVAAGSVKTGDVAEGSAARDDTAGGEGKAVLKAVRFLPDCALTHSVVLMDEIEKCLAESGFDKNDIDVFACAIGPGSFTGIRIGVATVKALAYALGKKVLGVTSFDSLAYNVSDGRKKLAVIDARHANYYVCGYDAAGKIDLSPRFMAFDELKKLSEEYEIASDTETGIEGAIVANVKDGFIKAVEDKLGNVSEDVETLVPLYVKKSQAEEEA